MPKQTPLASAFLVLVSLPLLAVLPLLAGPDESIGMAVYRHEADRLREARVNLCENRAVGQAFDIQDLWTTPVEGGLAVTYTLVRYESCEEGAAYYEVKRSETWAKVEGHWRKVISQARK